MHTEGRFMKTKCHKEEWLVKMNSLVNYAGGQFYQIPRQILPEPLTFYAGSLLMLVESTSVLHEKKKMHLNFKNDLEANFTIFLRRKTKHYWHRGVCLRIISPIDQLAVNIKNIHLSSTIPKSPWECLLADPLSTCGEDQTSTLCLLQSLTNETMRHYRLSHSSMKAQCYRHLAAKSLAVWTLRRNPDSHSVSLNN